MRSFASSTTQEWDVEHSAGMAPQDLLNFIYLDEFIDDWEKAFPNDVDEEALWALELLIMSEPDRAPVIPGTGGLRKFRFGRESSGKRGGIRVCYTFFPDFNFVLMLLAYPKNSKIDLTPDEKEGIKQYLDKIRYWLEKQSHDKDSTDEQ